MKLYICGPMTGLPEKNLPAFRHAEARLVEHGYEVLSPVRFEGDGSHSWEWYMRNAFRDVLDAEGIALLERWQMSRGAQLEVKVAEALKLRIRLWTHWVADVDAAH